MYSHKWKYEHFSNVSEKTFNFLFTKGALITYQQQSEAHYPEKSLDKSQRRA